LENQYEQFLSYDNFFIAFKRLQTVDGYVFYKSLYRPDIRYFGLYLEENLQFLIHNIKEGIYQPQHSFKIYIPKKNNLVRPLTLLHFPDLLVYQALINVIADTLYDEMSTYHNKIIFGNIFNKTNSANSYFLFRKWKAQWKKYNQVTEATFNKGYEYFSDFDIASFFDTINHDILVQILNKKGVCPAVTSLLKECLKKWTVAINRQNYTLNQGLPQGPIGSALLADIYLLPIDERVTGNKNLDIKYQRYVDDIRILSKSELEGKKALAYLDLLARDFGLIPQSSKIATRKIDNIKKELNIQHSKFSEIANEFNNNGKKLKPATHKKQKKQFLNCFSSPTDKKPNDDFLNKTIISFSLFKLNKDDDVKNTILSNLHNLYAFMEGVLFYLSKHYSNDAETHNKLKELLEGDHLLFQHVIALIYKEFPHLPFSEDLFVKHYENNNKFWLIKYYVLDWLRVNGQNELILSLKETDNYYINRKLISIKHRLTSSVTAIKNLLRDSMKSKDSMLALQAHYLYVNRVMNIPSANNSLNIYIKNIITNKRDNYISYTLASKYGVSNAEHFFDASKWNKQEFEELRMNFLIFIKHLELDPSVSLMSLNIFNEMVFNQILKTLGKSLSPGADYGGSIEIIKEDFPTATLFFDKINQARNQKTYAHYKDKTGNIRIKISFSQLHELLDSSMFLKAMTEVCDTQLPSSQSAPS